MTWLEWLAATPPAMLLQRSGTAYLLVNAAHIASLGVLIGTIVALDLRLLGLGRQVPINTAGSYLSRLAAAGLVLAIFTGFWLFTTQPEVYLDNTAFLVKLGLVCAGVLNALCLHVRPAWQRIVRAGAPAPASMRLQAATSMLLWFFVILAGRWIGFL